MTVKNVVYPRKIHYFGRLIKLCQTTRFGVQMPKEPKIMRMDWKALGYEREYKDGRLRWIPRQVQEAPKDEDTSA
jgi:hypothetical protein